MHLKRFALIACSLLVTACDDGSYVNFYNKNLKEHKISCLSYIPASNGKLDKALQKLYKFSKNCPYRVELSYKSDIVCHSPYNVPQKVNSNFPSAYIKLEVKKGFKLQYSYYKDLTSKPDTDDLKTAFERLKRDILN